MSSFSLVFPHTTSMCWQDRDYDATCISVLRPSLDLHLVPLLTYADSVVIYELQAPGDCLTILQPGLFLWETWGNSQADFSCRSIQETHLRKL